MMRILKRVGRLIIENFWWKVLSLAIAVVLWVVVASEPELATFATVRLEYRNLPEDLEISSQSDNSVLLELRGPSGELRGLGDGGIHPAVVLNMSNVRPGERTFAIDNSDVQLMHGVRLVRAIPSEVRFRFERHRVRNVTVLPRFVGEGQNGYTVAGYTVDPKQLQIVGPNSRVTRITSVVTDPMDVSSMVGTAEFHVNAFVDDAYVHFQDSPQVTVTVTMKKM
jgi:YbbR domain-containing protein